MIRKILFIFSLFILCQGNSLKLKQVFIFSRHNLRSPIRPDLLPTYTPRKWPMGDLPGGQLTAKGALLEGYMGQYFRQWFASEQFLQEGCPDEDTAYVYANSMNRTVQTAEVFVKSAFKGCNMTVHHKFTPEAMDPTFSPVVRNTTAAFKNLVIDTINHKLENAKLRAAFLELNKILDIKHSEICKHESICDLSDRSKNSIRYAVGQDVCVDGPLYISSTAVDAFLMSYFEGLPLEEVAWGFLNSPQKWKLISEIEHRNHYIRFTTVAKDTATPLLNYLQKYFGNNDDAMPKFFLMVGHDFNLNAIINCWGFKPVRLPNHYELYPIGGRIVFQRWTDNNNDYLKMEYVYPSWEQSRNGTKFSMTNPPQRVLLQFKWCNVDENGFCPWSEFVTKLSLLQ